MKKITLMSVLVFGTFAVAADNTFKVHIWQNSIIEGKAVKAGEYKVSVENGNAVLKQGKESIEVPAHEEAASTKAASTEMFYKDNTTLQQIKVGGTHTTIIFDSAPQTHAGA